MKPITVAQIAKAVGGTLIFGTEEAQVSDVIIDSRQAHEGALFVPIIGERVDAHRFIPDVMVAGASCTFTSKKDVTCEKGAGIYVEDTLDALQKLAAWYRRMFEIPVVGITGSVGKTTTKEMISAVLEKKFSTVKTIGNLNSQIGVSLMIFGRVDADGGDRDGDHYAGRDGSAGRDCQTDDSSIDQCGGISYWQPWIERKYLQGEN